MRRTDRLFALLNRLGDHALHRAGDLAARQGVSVRTLYRDIARLRASGVPVEGTPGAGYRLERALTLPPLTLSDAEVEALQIGLAVILQTPDPALHEAATSLTAKIDAALPEVTLPDAAAWQQIAAPFADMARGLSHLPTLRAAIRARQKLRIVYSCPDGRVETHVLRPERLDHLARSWVLSGWSESTKEAAQFRLDLIDTATALPELFTSTARPDGPGETSD
jgi:predicted DNA-binding transcriptional regulator YafY